MITHSHGGATVACSEHAETVESISTYILTTEKATNFKFGLQIDYSEYYQKL